ncbi:hypothetical protein K491DRAFT_584638 [Lophiostoma macrostomum CBS 122681]|uniref:Uncharacterized protein n=1 Tax=Lophiostoma macrostomum CBS 122681 TaxID=1314788 RepID=A0A6A6TVA2_9PLEO|nr:hypothetical protein K491DRAFT_584638 [Lophiostoma macrostomum CBS 122681]
MRRTGSGRIARKIGAYDEDSGGNTDTSQSGAESRKPDTVVKRPAFAKVKKRSSLRVSFGPGESDGNDGDESSDAAVITPKKSNLSRIAIEKNAELRARLPLVSQLPRASLDEDRPSYSKDHLAELRNSTPATPKDLVPTAQEEEDSQALDIASKFGSSATIRAETPSAIPTQAEIQEKKARRARLAQEQNAHDDEEDRPWASDDDDEFRTSRNEISLRPKEKYAETRLIREDEDMAEGFEDYTEDGNIALGRKAEREAQRKKRVEMAELIKEAEKDSDDDGSDDSEAERHAAYEAAQTRAGTYGKSHEQADDGDKTPPKITPLLDLGDVLQRFQADVQSKEQRKEALLRKLEELKEERVRIAERKTFLQEQLQKTGDEYEKLRQEAGMAALPINGGEGGRLIVNRGLDSMGTTPVGQRSENDTDELGSASET